MSKLETQLRALGELPGGYAKTRLLGELNYARRLSQSLGGKHDSLIASALSQALNAASAEGAITNAALSGAEQALSPIAAACKQYRLLCVGHAHIDMNWMWRYDETVSITLDTFRTVLNLMKDFPDFVFAQSQASVYEIVEQYEPEMLDEIRARIQAGRWEVSASTWVEADRNMPSQESVARHHLYTKRYLPALLGISPDQQLLDYEPDTFGHNKNVPEMLSQAGVKYYYHCRGYDGHVLYRWRSPSGREIMVYREPYWYLGPVDETFAAFVPDFCKTHGMDTAIRTYGVGDHGGGPTRRDLERIADMGTWPIFPRVEFGSYGDFYKAAEGVRDALPVVEDELNFVFTGCYTTQTRIKMGNRMGERLMQEAESINAVAALSVGAPYRREAFEKAWRNILFNQFHDIIPGSGVIDTREYAMGIYSHSFAIANSARRLACQKLSEAIDTSRLADMSATGTTSEGAGVGHGVYGFQLGSVDRGRGDARIFHLYNPLAVARKEVVELVAWDYKKQLDRIQVCDAQGNKVRHQVIRQGHDSYWGHDFTRVYIEAEVPALGYATYVMSLSQDAPDDFKLPRDPRVHKPYSFVLENDLVRAEFDPVYGDLIELSRKQDGEWLESAVEPGMGGFQHVIESAQEGMTSWTVGRYMQIKSLQEGLVIRKVVDGPLVQAIEFSAKFGASKIKYLVTLVAGSPVLDYQVECDWHEIGSSETGIPQLRYVLTLMDVKDQFLYDVPMGFAMRDAQALDLPSQGLIAATDEDNTLALLCDTKYGFRGDADEMSVTLLRSSFDPDPYPENGIYKFRIGVAALAAGENGELAALAQRWNVPITVVSGHVHEGALPASKSFIELVEGNVIISAVKLAEDGNALILRGYEPDGLEEPVRIRLSLPASAACLADTLEQPIGPADVEGGVVSFTPRAFGAFTLRVEM